MKSIIIIPARLESTRLPKKLLLKIKNKPIIIHTVESCIKCVGRENVFVATDSKKIKEVVESYGYKTLLTDDCKTGTDRVAESLSKLTENYDFIVNVQGDEPFINSNDIQNIIYEKTNNINEIITGINVIDDKDEFFNPNVVKMVIDKKNYLMYSSRSPIPITKNKEFKTAYKHTPIYAFTSDELKTFSSLEKTPLEQIEDIEILRFLEIGIKVKTILTAKSHSVDTLEDYQTIKNLYEN